MLIWKIGLPFLSCSSSNSSRSSNESKVIVTETLMVVVQYDFDGGKDVGSCLYAICQWVIIVGMGETVMGNKLMRQPSITVVRHII